MNYTELLANVQTYLDNSETGFVALIPEFVKMAEQRIFHEAQLPASSNNSTGNLTAGNQYLTVPTGFLSMDSFAAIVSGAHTYLTFVDKSFIRECYPSVTTQGVPKYYALFDHDTFLIGPTPNDAYAVELHYFGLPESIVTAGTSWLGDNFSGLLLNATLVEAYRQMKGDADILENYNKAFQEDLSRLKIFSAARSRNDLYRSGQFTAEMEA